MYAPFVISGILWHEIGEKVAFTNTARLREVLNQHLHLSDYGTGLKGIAFIFVVTQPNDEIHREHFIYRSKAKELHVQVRLPYTQVDAASLPEVLQLMAEKYLEVLRKNLPKRKIDDFDTVRFVEDVRTVLEKEGILETVVVG